MRKLSLLLVLLTLTLTATSQNKFVNGYIIKNNGTKLECLINNLDWRSNPTKFEYKISENTDIKIGSLKDISEFRIKDGEKFIRYEVEIDRSNNLINKLSDNADPEYNTATLFLKQLLSGEANLFLYKAGNLNKYFFSTNILETPKQLFYKKYTVYNEKIGADNVFENNQFRRQLSSNFKCEKLDNSVYNTIEYKKNSLLKFFKKYDNCKGVISNSFESNTKRKTFYFNIRPSIRSSQLKIDNSQSIVNDVSFDKKTSFSLGFEAEFILPSNNGKWSVIIEPTIQSYKNEKEYTYIASTSPITTTSTTIASVEYKSVELPIGIRHYMFLTDKSKLFINAVYTLDFNNTDKQIEYSSPSLQNLDINSRNNFGIGIGYNFDNKYSVEFRQNTKRNILGDYAFFSGNYSSTSIIFGVNIF